MLPAVAYISFVGIMGITTKLALRDADWRQLVLWSTLAYAAFSVLLVVTGTRPSLGSGAAYAAVTGILAATTFALYMLAIGGGDVSKVAPFLAGIQ